MSKLYFDYTDNADMKAKQAAAITLYGSCAVRLTGTWQDKSGDAVFFDYSHSEPIERIAAKYITVDVDGELSSVAGMAGASGYVVEVA